MNDIPAEEEILAVLLKEICIITGNRTADPDQSLHANGINSMGFMELLLAAEKHWNISLIDKGITAKDIENVRIMASFIRKGLRKE